MTPSVYLAGPIRGLHYDETVGWRDKVTLELLDAGVTAFSPMRFKEFLHGQTFTGQEQSHPLATARGSFTRDHFDVRRADAVLMNLAGSQTVSIGSMMEAAWTVQSRTPLVVVLEEGNVHDHPFLWEAAGFIVPTLEEAVEVVIAVLCP